MVQSVCDSVYTLTQTLNEAKKMSLLPVVGSTLVVKIKTSVNRILSSSTTSFQGERGIPGQQGMPGQQGRSIAGAKVNKLSLYTDLGKHPPV